MLLLFLNKLIKIKFLTFISNITNATGYNLRTKDSLKFSTIFRSADGF